MGIKNASSKSESKESTKNKDEKRPTNTRLTSFLSKPSKPNRMASLFSFHSSSASDSTPKELNTQILLDNPQTTSSTVSIKSKGSFYRKNGRPASSCDFRSPTSQKDSPSTLIPYTDSPTEASSNYFTPLNSSGRKNSVSKNSISIISNSIPKLRHRPATPDSEIINRNGISDNFIQDSQNKTKVNKDMQQTVKSIEERSFLNINFSSFSLKSVKSSKERLKAADTALVDSATDNNKLNLSYGSSRAPSSLPSVNGSDNSPHGTTRSTSGTLRSSQAISLLFSPSIISSTANSSPPRSVRSLASTLPGEPPRGWEKVYSIFRGVMGKSKKPGPRQHDASERRGKRLNATRLSLVQERIRDSKADFLPHTDIHLINYAPLFTLKLISILFSDEAARSRLAKTRVLRWGMRWKVACEFVEIDAPYEHQKGPKQIGQTLTPKAYVSRVVKECWKAILKIGRGSGKDECTIKSERRRGLWFLRQFCVLYGFGVIKLGISSHHMLPQLMLIANLPELSPIMPFIEDTIYSLENSKLGLHRPLAHRRGTHYARRKVSARVPSVASHSSLRHSRSSSVPFSASPLSSISSQLPHASSSEEALGSTDSSKVTLERVVMYLMECLTRARAPDFPADLFGEIIKCVPRGSSVVDPLNKRELELCVEYLLSHDFIVSPDRWFRESCDQQQLALLNSLGLEDYLIKHTPSISQGSVRGKRTDGNSDLFPILDPRLVASHLKHIIYQLGGLVPMAVAKAVMLLMPNMHNCSSADSEWWLPELEVVQMIKSLLALSLFHFQLLQKVVQVTQRLLPRARPSPSASSSISSARGSIRVSFPVQQGTVPPHDLAIVLPVIPAHVFTDICELKKWNSVWGHLLGRGRELFLDPNLHVLAQISPRVQSGFRFALELLRESGVKFLS